MNRSSNAIRLQSQTYKKNIVPVRPLFSAQHEQEQPLLMFKFKPSTTEFLAYHFENNIAWLIGAGFLIFIILAIIFLVNQIVGTIIFTLILLGIAYLIFRTLR